MFSLPQQTSKRGIGLLNNQFLSNITSIRNVSAKITSIHAITSLKTTAPTRNHTIQESTKRKLLLERPGLFAIKRGMITWFNEKGEHIPATVLEVDSCEVLGYKLFKDFGYTAVIMGTIDKLKNVKSTNDLRIFETAKVSPKQKIGEFKIVPLIMILNPN